MANMSQFLIRSIVGAVITTAALASTGCSTTCHSSRCETSKSQSECGTCAAKGGVSNDNYYSTSSPK